MISFTVVGEPVTKGSVTAFVPKRADGSYVKRPDGSPLVVKHDDTGDRGKSSAGDIAKAALAARTSACERLYRDSALSVTLRFYVLRPSGQFGSGRNSGLVKDSAPAHPAKRPDVDKYVRHVLDALKGVVYADDGQVVEVSAVKLFGDPARTEVEIQPMPEQTMGELMRPALTVAA